MERLLLSMLVVVAGLAAIYGLYRLVFLGRAFTVEKVVVEGDWNMLSGDEVAQRSGVKAGDNLFWISVTDIHERLREEPWIEEVAVRRKLPDTLWIYVDEFSPVAIIAANDFYFVDEEGTLIKKVESGERIDLPVLSGIPMGSADELTADNGSQVREMLALLDSFDSSRFGRAEGISEINYDAIEGYSIVTRSTPMKILIGKTDFDDRIRQIDRMINAIKAERPPIRYMVANENGRVIVRYRPS